jgi:hypothetical protein
MHNLKGHGMYSDEGKANMRRARETLKPGDIVWYPPLCQSPIVVVENTPGGIIVLHLYPESYKGGSSYVFHNDWELVGHSDELLAALTRP